MGTFIKKMMLEPHPQNDEFANRQEYKTINNSELDEKSPNGSFIKVRHQFLGDGMQGSNQTSRSKGILKSSTQAKLKLSTASMSQSKFLNTARGTSP